VTAPADELGLPCEAGSPLASSPIEIVAAGGAGDMARLIRRADISRSGLEVVMSEHRLVLDAFADARRTWDDLVTLQPDVVAGSGNLKEADLVELENRVEAHRMAVDTLADALETEPPDVSRNARSAGAEPAISGGSGIRGNGGNSRISGVSGISNRESADQEAEERQHLRPIDEVSAEPEDAAGRVGEQPLEDHRDRHTSHKAGSRSIAQKEAESRYPDHSMPPSKKVAGAFGKEPKGPATHD
jgi:hypothetical protein